MKLIDLSVAYEWHCTKCNKTNFSSAINQQLGIYYISRQPIEVTCQYCDTTFKTSAQDYNQLYHI